MAFTLQQAQKRFSVTVLIFFSCWSYLVVFGVQTRVMDYQHRLRRAKAGLQQQQQELESRVALQSSELAMLRVRGKIGF